MKTRILVARLIFFVAEKQVARPRLTVPHLSGSPDSCGWQGRGGGAEEQRGLQPKGGATGWLSSRMSKTL